MCCLQLQIHPCWDIWIVGYLPKLLSRSDKSARSSGRTLCRPLGTLTAQMACSFWTPPGGTKKTKVWMWHEGSVGLHSDWSQDPWMAGATCTYQPTTAAVVAAEAAGGRQGALLRRWAPVELNRIDTQHDGHRPWGSSQWDGDGARMSFMRHRISCGSFSACY